jgi:hypothetical protein
MVVVGCDYGATDDLLRLACQFDVDTVTVLPLLAATFRDVAMLDTTNDSLMVIAESMPGSGVVDVHSYNGNVLVLDANSTRIVFADRLTTRVGDMVQPDRRSILVIGGDWYARDADVSDLVESGYDMLVCSKVAQAPDLESGGVGELSRFTGSIIKDLILTGSIQISL